MPEVEVRGLLMASWMEILLLLLTMMMISLAESTLNQCHSKLVSEMKYCPVLLLVHCRFLGEIFEVAMTRLVLTCSLE